MNTFEITIPPKLGEIWPVVVAQGATEPFLPVRQEDEFRLDMGDLLSQVTPREYGTVLGKALFREGVRHAFSEALKPRTTVRPLSFPSSRWGTRRANLLLQRRIEKTAARVTPKHAKQEPRTRRREAVALQRGNEEPGAGSVDGSDRSAPVSNAEAYAAAPRVDLQTKVSGSGVVEPAGEGEAPPTRDEAQLARFSRIATVPSTAVTDFALTTSWQPRLRTSVPWLAGWSLGVLALSLRLLGIWIRVQRLCRVGVQPAGAGLGALLGRIVARLAVSRSARVLQSTLVPKVIGWLAPVILIPILAIAAGARMSTFLQTEEDYDPDVLDPIRGFEIAALAPQKAAPNQALTPALIADRMEQTMRQYDAIDYTVEFDERRNINAFMRGRPPVIVEGKGKLTYRGDAWRWLADEHSFTYNVGDTQVTPRHMISGFDGSRHYHFDGSLFVWGEDDLGKERTHPRTVLWHGGRSTDNLLAALRKPEAKIVRRVDVNNHPCIVVSADWIDEWDESRSSWHFEATISPEQAYLPLDTLWNYKGKLNVRTEVRGLKRSDDGLWYPLMIRRIESDDPVPRKVERIVSLDGRAGKPFRDDELRLAPPLGADVLDLRTRLAWHIDPWWPEMAPWLKDKLDWPPPTGPSGLFDLQSFCAPSMAGASAPAIEARQWINGDPGGWNRKERIASVLYFFGGRLVSPHPKWVTALRTWHAAWKEDGVELIGIATSDSIDTARQGVEELGLTFPVAIDRPAERRGSFGRTFDAYKLQNYSGVVVVDPQGKVQLLEAGPAWPALPLEVTMRRVFEAAGRKPKAPVLDRSERRLAVAQAVAIEAEWKRIARASTGSAKIRGTLSLAKGTEETPAPTAGPIDVQVVPQFRMLGSDEPGYHALLFDRDRLVNLQSDASGRFAIEGLRKGRYVVTFQRPGFAALEREILLADESAEVVLDAELPPDGIAGQVVDDAGAPIRGAAIKVTRRHLAPPHKSPATTAHVPRRPVVTDDSGQFRLDQLYEGAYTFEVSATGFETSTIELIPPGRRDVKVVLKAAQ